MKTYGIAEAAVHLGLSKHTLRYYERAGLLGTVSRVAGRRCYSEADLIWLQFIQRLRATDMPMRKIERYAQLRRQGDVTADERLALLLEHMCQLEVRESELIAHRRALADKIEIYRRMLQSTPTASAKTGKGERK